MQQKRAKPKRKAPLMYTMPEGETPGIIWGAQEAIVEEINPNTVELSIEFVENSIAIVERLHFELKDQHDYIFNQMVKVRNEANSLMANNEYALLDLKYKELNSIAKLQRVSKQKVSDLEYILKCLTARKEEYYVTSYRL